MGESEPVIKVENVHHKYPDGTVALKGINLDVYPGDFVAFIGQNGSGKTTLVKHFNGLLKPTEGRIVVNGVDTAGASAAELSRHVGYVFQNPDHQLCCNSVQEEITFGPRNLGVPKGEIDRRVENVIKLLELEAVRNVHPFFLSKGMRQRLALASVLSMEPEVLVVDESFMDARQAFFMMNFLQELNKEGHTVVMITHYMRLVAEYAKRTVVLRQGLVMLDAATREVFAQPEILEKTFLSPPQITQLSQSLPQHGFPPDILTVDEMYKAFDRIYAKSLHVR